MKKESEKVYSDEEEHTVGVEGKRKVSERMQMMNKNGGRKVREFMVRKINTQGKRRKGSE